MTELPEDLLRNWPGRFRFAELVVRLIQERLGDPVAAVLDGMIADRTEQEVLAELIEAGHYAAAAHMLDRCDVLSEEDIARAHDLLERSRARSRQIFADQLRQLEELADRAGLDVGTNDAELADGFDRSWPTVERRLNELRDELIDRIDDRADGLRTRAAATQLADPARAQFESLVRDNRLRAADNLLRRGSLGTSVPETVPRAPQWSWPGVSAEEVLQWHLSPNSARPPEFTRWEPVDDTGRQLLDAWAALGVGGESAARRFTAALDTFLGPAPDHVEVHPVEGGYLGKLENLFDDDRIGRFRPAGGTDLFIVDPTTVIPPREFPGVQRFIAVGPTIRECDGSGRGDRAALTLRDVLRLVTLASGRQVSLLRMVGKQWPLSAFGCGSPTDLAQRLGPPGADRLQHLCWLADLLGVGGSAAADELVFQGDDARVLHVFLEYLTRTTTFDWRGLNRWREDKRLAGSVEAAVLYPIETAPFALAAFWAALGTAPPGTTVTSSELVRTVALYGLDWDRELRDGLDRLSRHWFVAAASEGEVTLRHCGTLIGLSDLVEARLNGLVQRVADAVANDPVVSSPTAWTAYRCALDPQWPAYHALYRQDPHADSVTEARRRLTGPPEDPVAAAAGIAGTGDLAAIAGELSTAFGMQFPDIELTVEAPPELRTELGDRIVYVLLYELLTNAAEALPTGGAVVLTMAVSDGDVLIDVRDTGPGVAAEVAGHRMFRRGISTRGVGRGRGLWVAKQLVRPYDDCDIQLVSARGGHPVHRGAYFRVVLPFSPGGMP
ncbi:ATP-binding protein [Nocardia sp. alder85J]|uniref:ATP-binding protein n=1 Tax=Nocardia sp. alder85J TaxID=2862949 RepID=UPI001CD76C9E|nr:ATP-binding protein [Nocardia sp. alder85J]MCX4094961.1 ATP-binding protein [Nocardia sp. alder85J]